MTKEYEYYAEHVANNPTPEVLATFAAFREECDWMEENGTAEKNGSHRSIRRGDARYEAAKDAFRAALRSAMIAA